jgi:hypothetical protein
VTIRIATPFFILARDRLTPDLRYLSYLGCAPFCILDLSSRVSLDSSVVDSKDSSKSPFNNHVNCHIRVTASSSILGASH